MSDRLTVRDGFLCPAPFVEGRHYVVDDETGCWNWQLFKLYGYGKCGAGYAHREAYRAAAGEIPEGYDVHHCCENPACINPAHLEALDVHTHRRAHKQANSPLSREQVVEIRERAHAGESLTQLGPEYGVSRHAIQKIVLGINWQDAGGPIGEPAPRPCPNCGAPFANRARYCSNRCRKQFHSREQAEQRKLERRLAREERAAA